MDEVQEVEPLRENLIKNNFGNILTFFKVEYPELIAESIKVNGGDPGEVNGNVGCPKASKRREGCGNILIECERSLCANRLPPSS